MINNELKHKQRLSANSQHCILELRGLGKHLWQDISVKDYINAERDSWIKSKRN